MSKDNTNISISIEDTEKIISLLSHYADAIRGDVCMPNTAWEMINKSAEVKLFVDKIKSKIPNI